MTHGSPFGSCGCSNDVRGSASIVADTFPSDLIHRLKSLPIADFRLPIADCQLPIFFNVRSTFSLSFVKFLDFELSRVHNWRARQTKVRRTFSQIGNWQSEIGNDLNLRITISFPHARQTAYALPIKSCSQSLLHHAN